MKAYTLWYLKELKRKKMNLSIVFDHEIREQMPAYPAALTKHYKFFPKEYSTNSTMVIFGDHVVTYKDADPGVDDDVSIFVMVSAEVAESYRAWWRYLWNTLPVPKKKNR